MQRRGGQRMQQTNASWTSSLHMLAERDGAVEIGAGLQSNAELGNEGLNQEDVGSDHAVIIGFC